MFAIGYNTPGYLPEMDVYTVSTADEAKRALIDEMLRYADHYAMLEEGETVAEEITHTCEDLNLTDVSCGYSVVIYDPGKIHDLGTHFWIEANPHNDPRFSRDYSGE